MDIYISRGGQQFGPYSLADVQADLKTGNIVQTDFAWYSGASDWVRVSQIPGIVKLPSQPSTSTIEIILLILLSLLLPPVGLVIGVIRLCRKRAEGWAMVATALLTASLFLCIPLANLRKAHQLSDLSNHNTSTEPGSNPAPSASSPEPLLPRLRRILENDTYKARRSYDAEIADVFSKKALNDTSSKSAAQQFANGSYRLADMLAIIASQLDTKNNYASIIQSVISRQLANDVSATTALQQAANGSYRCVELLAIIVQEADRKGDYRTQIQSVLFRMAVDDTKTESAYQQIANGTCRMAEMLAMACKATDSKNSFGSEINNAISGMSINSSQTAMQESVVGLYASSRLMALFATLMDRHHIYADGISSQLRQLSLSDTTADTVYQQMAIGYYRLTDLAGYAAKALNP
jgi:hypothetical protein